MTFDATLNKTSRAAAQLVSRCPPRRSRLNMYAAEELACATFLEKSGHSSYDDDGVDEEVDEFRAQFLDKMVESVDQRVECIVCEQCTNDRNGGMNSFWFVASEYNRTGDAFRCPRCHTTTVAAAEEDDEASAVEAHDAVAVAPGKFIRWFEHAMNAMMSMYARLYYAHHDLADDTVVSSCYAWVLDDDNGEDGDDTVPPAIGVAVYIVHRHRGDGGNKDEDDVGNAPQPNRQQHQWTSSHVAHIRPSVNGSAYAFQSTVMLDIVQAAKDDEDAAGARAVPSNVLQKQRVHGLVATETAKFQGKAVALKSAGAPPSEQLGGTVVIELCEHLQRVENALRDTMEALYIGKVGSMMAQSLRVDPQKQLSKNSAGAAEVSASTRKHQDPVAAVPETSVPSTDPQVFKKNKKPKEAVSLWEAAQDDDGNTYYYHTVTGVTSWDVPPAEDCDTQQDASANVADDSGVPSQDAAEEEVDQSTHSVDPLTILEGLGLTQPADVYHKELKRYLRRFYGIKNFDEEAFLQLDDAGYTLGEGDNGDEGEQRQVLEVLVPAYGDRRKILKWITRRRAEVEEGAV